MMITMLKWQTHWMLALSGVSFWLTMWERQSLSRMAGKAAPGTRGAATLLSRSRTSSSLLPPFDLPVFARNPKFNA